MVVAVDIFDPIDREADSPVAPTERKYARKGISSHEDKLWFKDRHHAIDAGILAAAADAAASGVDGTPSSWVAPTVVSTCAEFVECEGGNLADGSGTTCFGACDNGNDCCDGGGGIDACGGFTGKVCKDGSCSGYQACTGAKIPTVVNSCKGTNACRSAGFYGGAIIEIIDSCYGSEACRYVGALFGSIGSITGSCIYDFACHGMATEYGKVGNLLNSCKGYDICHYVGSTFGIVGSITDSCNNYSSACINLGAFGGKVGDVIKSCTNAFACYEGAYAGGTVESITNSCTAGNSCFGLGRGDGNVGNVKDSCTELDSCLNTGFNRGSIGSISTSCNALEACKRAGSGLTGSIKSDLNGCCNEVGICESATQATLPKQCNSKVRMRVFAQILNLEWILRHYPTCCSLLTYQFLILFQAAKKRARTMN